MSSSLRTFLFLVALLPSFKSAGATRIWSNGSLLGKADTQKLFVAASAPAFNELHSFAIQADRFTLLVIDFSNDMGKQQSEGSASILFEIDGDAVHVLGDDKEMQVSLVKRVPRDPSLPLANTPEPKQPPAATPIAIQAQPTTIQTTVPTEAKPVRDNSRPIIQIVDSRSSERYFTQYVPGTAGHSYTNCNGNATVYSPGGGMATANGTTNCQTTTTPGRAPTTVQHSIQQTHVLAIMPDGRHVTLWCQAGFRRCSNLLPGAYETEIGGNTVWVYTHDLDGITAHRVKYRFVGGW